MLGQFIITGIPPAPKCVPQIEVTFDVDSNGIINVSSVDKSTNKMENITIKDDESRLSDSEIRRMVDVADKFKHEDDLLRESISAKNGLESYAFQVKSTVEDDKVKDRISEEDKKYVLSIVKEAISWLDANQTATREDFEAKQREVAIMCQHVLLKLYQSPKCNTS